MRFRIEERGHAILELAIVLPVLFLLAMASLELAALLKYHQAGSALSREIASIAYRDCVADTTVVGDSFFDPQLCMDKLFTGKLKTRLEKAAPGAKFIVSLYNYDGTTVSRDGFKEFINLKNTSSSSATPTGNSKFSKSEFTSDLSNTKSKRKYLTRSLALYGTLVVGEVYIPYTGLAAMVPIFVPFNVSSAYASTTI